MKNKITFDVRVDEETYRKLIAVAEKEGRSLNNQINMLARNAVAYHERAKGKFDSKELAAVELDAFFEEENE